MLWVWNPGFACLSLQIHLSTPELLNCHKDSADQRYQELVQDTAAQGKGLETDTCLSNSSGMVEPGGLKPRGSVKGGLALGEGIFL